MIFFMYLKRNFLTPNSTCTQSSEIGGGSIAPPLPLNFFLSLAYHSYKKLWFYGIFFFKCPPSLKKPRDRATTNFILRRHPLCKGTQYNLNHVFDVVDTSYIIFYQNAMFCMCIRKIKKKIFTDNNIKIFEYILIFYNIVDN